MKTNKFFNTTKYLSSKISLSLIINLLMASGPFFLPRKFNIIRILPSLLILIFGALICKII